MEYANYDLKYIMKILIVEDEKKIANFIKKGLEEENYLVDVVYDGETALRSIKNLEYDLVIMDVMIPKIDGFELCKRLRDLGFNKPILMLTVKNTVEDKVKGLDSGADDYLTKPFAFEELFARIRALLRKNNIIQNNTLKIADLEIDLISHKVKRGNRLIELTNKEYLLLEYLVRNKDKVVTRTMILENVWNIKFDTGSNIVDVFINYLRKKIDDGYKPKLIHTVRSRGYTLSTDERFDKD